MFLFLPPLHFSSYVWLFSPVICLRAFSWTYYRVSLSRCCQGEKAWDANLRCWGVVGDIVGTASGTFFYLSSEFFVICLSTWPALTAAFLHWFPGFNVWFTKTPNIFLLFIFGNSNVWPFILYSLWWLFCPMCMILHFPSLNCMPHFSAHRLSKVSCSSVYLFRLLSWSKSVPISASSFS